MINPNLENKTVLITGANHGIGAATAKAFALQGANVFISYFRDNCEYSKEQLLNAEKLGIGGDVLYRSMQQKSAEPIVEYISSIGGKSFAFEADLNKTRNIQTVFDLCEEKLGSVDILINNHTYCSLETFDPELVSAEKSGIKLISSSGIDQHFTVNTRSYALMMSEYLKRYLHRKASWGRIINISTDAAHAHISNVSYAASKHAIESYSRSAAIEMGKYGITVNILSPGPIQTGYIDPNNESEIIEGTPLGRIGQPEDIANVMIFLGSEQSNWITGQLIYVGGGWQMHQ